MLVEITYRLSEEWSFEIKKVKDKRKNAFIERSSKVSIGSKIKSYQI